MPPDADTSFALASAIIQVRPERLSWVCRQIAATPGVEIHGEDPRGCLIITLEGAATAPLADILVQLRDLDGVLAADLVYQHIEDDGSEPHHEETAL